MRGRAPLHRRRLRWIAVAGLLALALHALAPRLHAAARAAEPVGVAAIAADDGPALRAGAPHDAADCPICQELARGRSLTPTSAHAGLALVPLRIPLIGIRSDRAPRSAIVGAAKPRAPPLSRPTA